MQNFLKKCWKDVMATVRIFAITLDSQLRLMRLNLGWKENLKFYKSVTHNNLNIHRFLGVKLKIQVGCDLKSAWSQSSRLSLEIYIYIYFSEGFLLIFNFVDCKYFFFLWYKCRHLILNFVIWSSGFEVNQAFSGLS